MSTALCGTAVHVRNLLPGEDATLSPALLDHGMPFLDPDWAWAVTAEDGEPFALVVCGFAHGWLLLFRVLAVSPLPSAVPLNWFLEALPRVFAAARARGCVGFLTLLSDDRPQEVKIARIVQRLAKGAILPFRGSLGAGLLADFSEFAPAPKEIV